MNPSSLPYRGNAFLNNSAWTLNNTWLLHNYMKQSFYEHNNNQIFAQIYLPPICLSHQSYQTDCIANSYFLTLHCFQLSDNENKRKIYNRLSSAPKIEGFEDGMVYVQKRTHVLITDGAAVNAKVNSDCEKFTIADERFYPSTLAFVLPENSSYLRHFNKA